MAIASTGVRFRLPYIVYNAALAEGEWIDGTWGKLGEYNYSDGRCVCRRRKKT